MNKDKKFEFKARRVMTANMKQQALDGNAGAQLLWLNEEIEEYIEAVADMDPFAIRAEFTDVIGCGFRFERSADWLATHFFQGTSFKHNLHSEAPLLTKRDLLKLNQRQATRGGAVFSISEFWSYYLTFKKRYDLIVSDTKLGWSSN